MMVPDPRKARTFLPSADPLVQKSAASCRREGVATRWAATHWTVAHRHAGRSRAQTAATRCDVVAVAGRPRRTHPVAMSYGGFVGALGATMPLTIDAAAATRRLGLCAALAVAG